MKFFLFLLSSKILFFLLFTVIILSLNLTPLIAYIFRSPLGRTFALIHNNAQDFFFYLGLMNEGANGAWLTTIPYATEAHQSSLIFAYFLWLGKISSLLGLPFAITYHLLRIIASVFFLFTIFYLLFTIIKIPYPRLAFFFFLFAAPFMHVINIDGKNVSVPFMYWWTAMDPIRRVAYLPHHMIGGFLLITVIILLIRYFRGLTKSSTKAVVLIPILTLIHPPSLLILILLLPVSLLIYVFSNLLMKKVININKIIGLLVFWAIGLFFLLLMYFLTNRGLIWSNAYSWEKNQQLPIAREIIGAFGILFPLALIGALYAFLSARFDYILILCWFAVPLLLLPLAPKLGIANTRLIQGIPYLPLSLLSVLGMKMIVEIAVKLKKFAPVLKQAIPWAITIIFILSVFPTLSWSIRDQLQEYRPIFGNIYFDNRLNNAFSFINKNFPKKAITLSTIYTGNYLPSFTHTVSFTGHFGYTYNVEAKEKQVAKFFQGKMSADEAKKFLLDNKIDLVFQGPEEKPIYSGYLYPQILKPVYDRDEATIYILGK